MEIYKNNLEYAKKNGEREQYLQSLELCDKCGAFIRHSIAVNFNFTTKDRKSTRLNSSHKHRSRMPSSA